MCSGKVNSVCSTSGARRVTLISKPDYDKDKGNISWYFVTRIYFATDSHGGNRKA